jgi:hypothetical protein
VEVPEAIDVSSSSASTNSEAPLLVLQHKLSAFEKKVIGKRLKCPCLYKLRFSDSTSTCGDGDGCIKSLRLHRSNRSTLLCK